MYSVGVDEALHGSFEFGLTKSLSLPCDYSRAVVRRRSIRAEVLVLLCHALYELEENVFGLYLTGQLVEAGNSTLGQKQAALIPECDRLRDRAVLVLLELKLAQIGVGLLAVVGL